MFPHILQAQNDPPILIYTPPPGEVTFDTFGGLAGLSAGPGRSCPALGQLRPKSAPLWGRLGQIWPISAPASTTFPDFLIPGAHISGFLDFWSPHFRISRFPTPRFPDFPISHSQISGFLILIRDFSDKFPDIS